MMTDAKNEDLGSLIRRVHWLLKQVNQHQAARQYAEALQKTNELERVVWKMQQKLRTIEH